MRGLEPPRINSLEPKPSASTNSATSTCYLCLGIEPSFQVHCLPVLTNRLPEDVVGVDNFTYVIPLYIHSPTEY
jgi:hypothetical protein